MKVRTITVQTQPRAGPPARVAMAAAGCPVSEEEELLTRV